MKVLIASDSELSSGVCDMLKMADNQVDCTSNCDTMEGTPYDIVFYDSTPCMDDRFDPPNDHVALLDFSDVVVSAYRLVIGHPEAYHVLVSSDEALYRDGGFYGNNRKLVEEVYFLAHKYLVVRCARILGNSPDSLLDRLLEYRPIPYTLESSLQFVGLKDVLGLLSTCIDKLRIPTVVTVAGSGCVTVEELCATAQITPVIADGAKKVIRDCDSSIADRMHPFKSSMDYAKDYIDRRKVQEAFIRG